MQVFISHSSRDTAFVESELLPLLQFHSIKPWYSPNEIPSASIWEKMIRQGLESSTWFAVVLSPNAILSQWVQAEVSWAIENRPKHLIPILIDDCFPADLHLRLISYQFVDFRKDPVTAKRDLLKIWETQYTAFRLLKLTVSITGVNDKELAYEQTLLISDTISIGRSSSCEIVLPLIHVSRCHASIKTSILDGDLCVLLFDLSSAAGTFVNGSRFDRYRKLEVGDVIGIGTATIVVKSIQPVT